MIEARIWGRIHPQYREQQYATMSTRIAIIFGEPESKSKCLPTSQIAHKTMLKYQQGSLRVRTTVRTLVNDRLAVLGPRGTGLLWMTLKMLLVSWRRRLNGLLMYYYRSAALPYGMLGGPAWTTAWFACYRTTSC